jgi:uncharacterized membrane protein
LRVLQRHHPTVSQTVPRTRFGRLLLARRRLFGAILAGIATGLVLPLVLPCLRWPTRLLAAWDVTALIYVVFAFRAMHGSTVAACRRHAALYDENDWVILFLIISAAAASFGAIVAELIAIKANEIDRTMGAAIIGATVVLSWTFVHVVYALHYAHLYYRPHKGSHPGGLKFPGDEPPTYPDFLYYSFVIGCAAQTADVATVSREMRRLTLIHGIVSFAFNTMILALMINTGSTLIVG